MPRLLGCPRLLGYRRFMDQQVTRFELDDEGVARQAAMARATVLQRLELVWALAQEQLQVAERPDARWAELAVRVLDRQMRLFRLDLPVQAAVEVSGDVVREQRVSQALGVLGELEGR